MKIGPAFRRSLHGFLSCHPYYATWAPATAVGCVLVECHEMKMGVAPVVARLVVYGQNIPGPALCQFFGELLRQH